MRVVIRSTSVTVDNGDVSLVAIGETLLAIAISFLIVLRWQDIHHLAVGVALSPLLLMRTPYSTRLCWATYGHLTALWYHRFGMPLTRLGEYLEIRLPRRFHLLYNIPIAAVVTLSPAPLVFGCQTCRLRWRRHHASHR
jgi:hypothetical protein